MCVRLFTRVYVRKRRNGHVDVFVCKLETERKKERKRKREKERKKDNTIIGEENV